MGSQGGYSDAPPYAHERDFLQYTSYSRSRERNSGKYRTDQRGKMSELSQFGRAVVLALGANLPSRWGAPPATFARAVAMLSAAGFTLHSVSSLYRTRAVGPGLQDGYYNAVIAGYSSVPPAVLLRAAKRIERAAGRRRGRTWGPRPLDIDLIDFKGLRLGTAGRQRVPGQLILPHPELHKRSFVLVPLAEALPHWHHPQSGVSAATLLKRLDVNARRGVGSRLAFPQDVCEKPQ